MGRKNLLVRVTVKNPCNQAVVQIKMVKRKFMTKKDIPPFCVWERERERERESKLPQIVLAQEVDPFFGKDNQHSPNMASVDVSVHLNGKTTQQPFKK